MQIDTGPEDSDANRVMVESTTLVNMKAFNCFCYLWWDFSLHNSAVTKKLVNLKIFTEYWLIVFYVTQDK